MDSLDEEFLEAAAKDGSVNYERWPRMLERLLARLDHIVYNDFPVPKMPLELTPAFNSQPLFPSTRLFQDLSPLSSSNKENAPPPNLQTPPRLPVPVEPSSLSSDYVPDSQQSQTDVLSPPLTSLLASTKSTLRHSFTIKPPHTIQRLAELILRPTHHYRTLPAYLRALDRVVSVSSSADTFPLPQTGIFGGGNQPNGVVNGSCGFILVDNSLGSDESLGGALLTPIPWLTNRGVENMVPEVVDQGPLPSGLGAETMTQEELQREQQVTVRHTGLQGEPSNIIAVGSERRGSLSPDNSEEIPHALGPPVLGVEDLGLQNGKGIELSLTDECSRGGNQEGADPRGQSVSERHETTDGDGDIVLDDPAGRKTGQEAQPQGGTKEEPGELPLESSGS